MLLDPALYTELLRQAGYLKTSIWFEGDASLLRHQKVAIVGTRKPSLDGLRRTRRLVNHLSSRGLCIVSGLAEGIDTAAHETSLDSGGSTIAVLGTPLDKCFPAKNRELMAEIAHSPRGLLLSQFPEGARIGKSNFPIRNRLMAALSDLTIVVEATEKSGTRHQVAACVSFKRPVGFLASMVRLDFDWVANALDSGWGFVVKEPGDITAKLFPVTKQTGWDF